MRDIALAVVAAHQRRFMVVAFIPRPMMTHNDAVSKVVIVTSSTASAQMVTTGWLPFYSLYRHCRFSTVNVHQGDQQKYQRIKWLPNVRPVYGG